MCDKNEFNCSDLGSEPQLWCNICSQYCPSFHTEYVNYHQSIPQPHLKTTICQHSERINGLPVELAVRAGPFSLVYPKKHVLNRQHKTRTKTPQQVPLYKPQDPNAAILDNAISGSRWDSRFCLKRIYYLLVRDVTHSKLGERVWALWSVYEKNGKDVFKFENSDIVANIILVLSTNFITLKYAKPLFDKVMQRLQRGLYVASTMKNTLEVNKLAYFFTVLGIAIVEGHPIVQSSISSILGIWLEMVTEHKLRTLQQSKCCSPSAAKSAQEAYRFKRRLMKPSTLVAARVPDDVLIAALEKSLLARTICEYFIDGAHTEGYISILMLLKTCCDVSSAIRTRLLGLPTLEAVLLKVSLDDKQSKILVATCEFVHSYFGINTMSQPYRTDVCQDIKQGVNNQTPGAMLEKDSFQVLLSRFAEELASCSSNSTLNIRNDIAFVICVIGEKVPSCGQYFEGFGMLIASIVSGATLGMKGIPMSYIIDTTPEDLELLQYLIFMLKCIVEADCGERIIEEYSTTAALTRLIFGPCRLTTTPSGCNMIINGEGEKCNDLENTAWATLLAIAQQCPLSLLTLHGAPTLMVYLQAFGQLGVGDENILVMCMHTIRTMLTTPEEDSCLSDEVMNYFIRRNGMAIFVEVLRKLVDGEFNILRDSLVSNTFHSCAALASLEYNQKEQFFALGGVSLLTKMLSCLISDSMGRRQLSPLCQMAVVECLNCCLAYFPKALEEFIAMEGIFKLVDLLETSAGPATPLHLVNCLLQLVEYPRAMDQMLLWHPTSRPEINRIVFGDQELAKSFVVGEGGVHGDNLQEVSPSPGQTLFSLLCSVWKDEEERFEVLRDPEGCIASIIHPLMSKFGRDYITDPEECQIQDAPCKSCLDLTLSIRPKIFLLVKRIVEHTRTEALLFDGLSLENQVLIHAIINFVDIKKSEIFLEIYQELECRQMAIPTDVLENVVKMAGLVRNTLATVLETQRFLIRRINEKAEMHETEFYTLLKQCNLQDHLLAATEVQFLARTTNYRFLVEKRLWQKSELQGMLQDLDCDFTKNTRVHRTSDGNLNITAWPCQVRSLISEPPVGPGDMGLANYDDNEEMSFLSTESESKDLVSSDVTDQDEMDSVKSSQIGFLSKVILKPSTTHVVASSHATENVTPEPFEGGYYKVSPLRLREALAKVLAQQRKHENWMQLAQDDEENFWKIRSKWRRDWYPI